MKVLHSRLFTAATRDSSNLLAHEAAFALGQMQDVDAIPALKRILESITAYHPIVRHEVILLNYYCALLFGLCITLQKGSFDDTFKLSYLSLVQRLLSPGQCELIMCTLYRLPKLLEQLDRSIAWIFYREH